MEFQCSMCAIKVGLRRTTTAATKTGDRTNGNWILFSGKMFSYVPQNRIQINVRLLLLPGREFKWKALHVSGREFPRDWSLSANWGSSNMDWGGGETMLIDLPGRPCWTCCWCAEWWHWNSAQNRTRISFPRVFRLCRRCRCANPPTRNLWMDEERTRLILFFITFPSMVHLNIICKSDASDG